MDLKELQEFCKKNKRDLALAVIVTIIASVFFLVVVIDALKKYYPEIIYSNLPEVQVVIPRGANALQIAQILQKAGAVHSVRAMRHQIAKNGLDKKIQCGAYKLHRASAYNVARQLATSKPTMIKFTIIPGTALCDLENMFERVYGKKNALYQAMSKKNNFPRDMRSLLPDDVKSRFVFLFPDTYYSSNIDDLADEVVRLASIEWTKKILPLLKEKRLTERAQKLGVLASIVEREALFDEDRPIIAGILHNRLRRGKELQCCSTVIYAWKIKGVEKSRLTYSDTNIDSPFNTYKLKGLPPMAICAPSLPSWQASISPKETDYLYFYSRSGGHCVYAKTYKEHLRNQR